MLLRVKEYIRQRSQMEGVNRRLAEKRILTFHVGYIYIYGKIHLFFIIIIFFASEANHLLRMWVMKKYKKLKGRSV